MITERGGMTIERAPKDRDNPYGMLRRAAFDGSTLTFDERGLLAYILMKPDNWKANIKDLMREGGIGREKVYKIINGLIAKGYAKREEVRGERGRFLGINTKFHEMPILENPEAENPLPEKPSAAKSEAGNQHHNNKGLIPTTDSIPITDEPPMTDLEKEAPDGAPAVAEPQKLSDHPAIKAYREFVERFPNKAQMKLIAETNPPIANWIRAVRTWIGRGNKPTNIEGMLEWALNPSLMERFSGNSNTRETMRNRGAQAQPDVQDSKSNGWHPSVPKDYYNEKGEYTGGWDSDELAAYNAARAAGDLELAGSIAREGTRKRKERMSQMQGHGLDNRRP